MIMWMMAALAGAATWTVDDDGPADFSSIQAAIDAAGPGDVIEVAAGDYTGRTDVGSWYGFGLTLRGDVTIRGAGAGQTVFRVAAGTRNRTACMGVDSGVVDVTVEGLTCISENAGIESGIYAYTAYTESHGAASSGNVTFRNVVFSLPISRGKAIVYHNSANLAVLFENSVIDFGEGTLGGFSYSNVTTNNLSLHNSIVRNTNAAQQFGSGAWDVSYTLTHPASVQPGTGNLSGDPLFGTDPATPYALLLGSPAIDAGNPDPSWNDTDGSRNDMGIYGGPGGVASSASCPVSHDLVDLPSGGTACIHPGAEVDDTVALNDNVRIDSGAIIAPRSFLGNGVHIGAGAIVGRRSVIHAGASVADDAVISRAVNIGANADIGPRSAIGYAASVGAGTELGPDTVLGALTSIGARGQVGTGGRVVIARGATVGDDAQMVGMGVIGPETTIGERFIAAGSFRLRKQVDVGNDVVLSDGVRVGRSGQVLDDADLGDSVTLGANACASGVVADDTAIARGALCE